MESETDKILKIFTFFGTELWGVMQELFAICVVIALISILITEAIKKSDEYVLTSIRFSKAFLWITNIFFNIFLSIVFVFVFDGKDGLLNTILYCITVFIFSWSLSEILYPISKFIFDYIEIVNLKLKKLKLDGEVLVKQTNILYNETNREYLLTKIKNKVEKL